MYLRGLGLIILGLPISLSFYLSLAKEGSQANNPQKQRRSGVNRRDAAEE